MQDIADSYSNNAEGAPFSQENHLSHPLPKKAIKPLAASAHLYPIDETEDFHDPFSDLSLFLSKKIKNEVEKHGSSRQWSHKIQQDLLSRILPEFTLKFPKYRIGLAAIKKVWEKVSYYYGKVHTHADALQSNGKLNIGFMIKENLKGYPFASMAGLPHYTTAHQIAVRISECVATLEGTRPKLERLTKIVWATQKHLIKDLPAQQSKHAHEEYDHIDKLIIKLILETTSHEPLIRQKDLEEVVRNKIMFLKNITQKYSSETLYYHFASLLSKYLYPSLSLHHLLNSEEKQKLRLFIDTQLSLVRGAKEPSYTSRIVETVQRILALYPLATSLPHNLSEETIRACIAYGYAKEMHLPLPPCPQAPASLMAFIHAEIHFLKRKEEMKDAKTVESILMKTLSTARALPVWRDQCADELEILIWHLYQPRSLDAPQERDFFTYEVESLLIEFPEHSFKNMLYHVLSFFKKLQKTLCNTEATPSLWEEIDHKIYLWSIQNDMLCRWIHFDPNNCLLKIIHSLWSTHKEENHGQFMQQVLKEFIKKNPQLPCSERVLQDRITLLYKYFWYHDLSRSEESSLDRFIKWHTQDICLHHKTFCSEDKITLLESRITNLLPLTPVSKRSLEKIA